MKLMKRIIHNKRIMHNKKKRLKFKREFKIWTISRLEKKINTGKFLMDGIWSKLMK